MTGRFNDQVLYAIRTWPSGDWYPSSPPTLNSLTNHFRERAGVATAWRHAHDRSWRAFVEKVFSEIDQSADPLRITEKFNWPILCQRSGVDRSSMLSVKRIPGVPAAMKRAFSKRDAAILSKVCEALDRSETWLKGARLTKEALAQHIGISDYLLFSPRINAIYEARLATYHGVTKLPSDDDVIERIKTTGSTDWVPGAPPTWKSLYKHYGLKKQAFAHRKSVVREWTKRNQEAWDRLEKETFRAIKIEAANGTLSWERISNRVGVKRNSAQNLRKIPGVCDVFAKYLARSFRRQKEILVAKAKEALKDPHQWLSGNRLSKIVLARHLGITGFTLDGLHLDQLYERAHAEYFAKDARMILASHLSSTQQPTVFNDRPSAGTSVNGSQPALPPARRARKVEIKQPHQAFESFVRAGQRSPALEGTVWDSLKWEPTLDDSSNRIRRSHRSIGALVFSNIETSTGKGSGQVRKAPMVEPYIAFAKAETRLFQEERNVTFGTLVTRMRGHRILEKIFRDHRLEHIEDFTLHHFYLAEEEAIALSPPTGAYSAALIIASIGEAIDRWGLCASPIEYRVRLKEPTRGDELSREGQEIGKAKMVSPEVLSALAQISSAPADADTRFIIRIVDLLLVGGFRIGEVLALPEDCWQEDETREIYTNAATGEKTHPCAITYAAEKASDFRPKPLSPSAVDVARRAINELQELCRPAREMARWMRKHPGRLKPFIDLDPNAWISGEDTCKRLGMGSRAYHNWLHTKSLPFRHEKQEDPTSRKGFQVGEIERFYLNRVGPTEILRMPSGRTLHLSEALIVTTEDGRSWLPRSLSYSMFAKRLCPDKWHRANGKTGLLPKTLKVSSHQFRHWLNTIADEGGLSEIDIAQFFGRKSLAQNSVYKHGTVAQRAEAFKGLIKEGKVGGQIARMASALGGPELETFLNTAVGVVHVTSVGACVHDFAALPCQYHHACAMGCGDYMRVRNDKASRNVLLQQRRHEVASLESSTRLLRDEQGGDNEFVKYAIEMSEKKIAGIDAALAIDDVPSPGADPSEPVKIFPNSSSRLVPIAK